MKIEILPEIVEEVSDSVSQSVYDTIGVLYDEFGTVPEKGSLIKVDLFGFIYEYKLADKKYEFNNNEQTLKITLVLKHTNSYEN
tara:strand:+ start:718 stop:969 length:252 start_codon:yes stop_codon:yes gene_type:complete